MEITNAMVIKASTSVQKLLKKHGKGEYWDSNYWNEALGRPFTAAERLEYETKIILEAAFRNKARIY